MRPVKDYLFVFGGLLVNATGIAVNAFWLVQPGNHIWWLSLAAIIVIGSLQLVALIDFAIQGCEGRS